MSRLTVEAFAFLQGECGGGGGGDGGDNGGDHYYFMINSACPEGFMVPFV